jgi:predicted dehydrogenase
MPLRVGFFGAGLIATYHSKSLHVSRADVTWSAVHDPDRDRAAQFAAASGAAVATSEAEVFDSSDAVYVCTWTAEHPRLVAEAAARGLAVFCEKPLATSLDAARGMAASVRDAGIVNQVGLVLRHSPAFALARDLVADPATGAVMNVVFRDDQFIPIQGSYRSTWRGDVDKAGAGTLLEHSIHDLDLLSWVIGPVASVSARSASFHAIPGIEDSVAVTLAFAGGAVGTLVSIWHDILDRPSLRRVEVFCERAHIVVENDWFGPVRWIVAGDGEGERELQGDALIAECEARGLALGNPDALFVAAVESRGAAWPSFSDAVAAHELVDAVYRSAAAGGDAVEVG